MDKVGVDVNTNADATQQKQVVGIAVTVDSLFMPVQQLCWSVNVLDSVEEPEIGDSEPDSSNTKYW